MASDAIMEVTDANFDQSVLKSDQPVLIDFWATWCAPCVSELPRVQAAFNKYREAGFVVVGISLDETMAAVVDPILFCVRRRQLL